MRTARYLSPSSAVESHVYLSLCPASPGGLHHAKKSEASGFCYVNDCVLAILGQSHAHVAQFTMLFATHFALGDTAAMKLYLMTGLLMAS